jgi:hypothetical protein
VTGVNDRGLVDIGLALAVMGVVLTRSSRRRRTRPRNR